MEDSIPYTHKEKISLYNAKTQRPITKVFKRNYYNSDEEFYEDIKNWREAFDNHNKNYNVRKTKEKNNEVLLGLEKSKALIKPVIVDTDRLKRTKLNVILDPDTGNTGVILGSSKMGKSTLLKHIYNTIYKKNKKMISTIFSTNIHANIYKGFEGKRLIRINCFTQECQNYIKLQKYINAKCKNKYQFLNMFDDILNTKYSNLINDMIMTYRNSNMSCWLSLQYVYLISKPNRGNLNNIFIFGTHTNESAMAYIDVFLKPYYIEMGYNKPHQWIKIFNEHTSDHGFYYINKAHKHFSRHRLNL